MESCGLRDLLHLRLGCIGRRRRLYGIAYPQINPFMELCRLKLLWPRIGGIGIIPGPWLVPDHGIAEVLTSAFISSTLRDGWLWHPHLGADDQASGILGARAGEV